MSGESPRRGLHKGAQLVSPQPISDRSIIDSVAGIINDIVPQAYTGGPNLENKERITWARFEYADVNDAALYPDYNEGSGVPPLLLVLGFGTGVQVWLVAASGEATEVLSWRQGIVRTLRILPNPKASGDERADPFESKRPMVAICDSAGPGPQFCSVNFVSLKTGEQAKSIKFKNPVGDILANGRSVVVTFVERIAVFDARTLEDILTVTTCYPSPGPNPNPVALGSRWLAYSEKRLLPARRSSGGSEGEGVQSYTAAVLYAAKSLGKGLRGLGETVASSLTGSATPAVINNVGGCVIQPGVVTILDLCAAKEDKELDDGSVETVIAHFNAHSDAIVAMTFDPTGALLMTADKRGHDFHVFRIQPHPGGPTLAAVHHLYVLHRGDTTAKVQDMTFSSDARWAAISTVRGTTHVFPVAPYGGPVGVRTHSTPHVVNRLSRFHRSAGLTDDGTRSHSPVSHAEPPLSAYPYSNPRLPPYPHPTILHPLAQIRQPSTLNHANSNQSQPRPQQRQRLHSDDGGGAPLKICACFAPPRAWIYAQRDSTNKATKRAIDSLFIMACHGNMIQYDLEPKPAAGVPKEKVCDDTSIELDVEAKGQWPLLRSPGSLEITPPLPSSSSLLGVTVMPKSTQPLETAEDRWLSQVEIVTHAGPHRRLWMGPQFVFKTYNAPSGVAVNLVEAEAVEVGVTGGSRPARSNPVNMPHATPRPLVPVVIDGSGSSYEQSPRFMEAYGDSLDNESMPVGGGENQLREDLAEAMLETSAAPHRVPGRRVVVEKAGQPVTKVVNPLGTVITVSADEEDVGSGQEFDDAPESTPEPPRSVCAEEGPASLGDFEPDGQNLRNLTEICVEMRSASEPAIDSVPSESIREVKERKTLCVEVARIGSNLDRDPGSIRDVPTSLSLCAEPGEVPNSPMTRAKENSWNRRSKCDVYLKERNIARAKYVVNYDEDSVVLMENKSPEKIESKSKRIVASKEARGVGRTPDEAITPKSRAEEIISPRRTRGKSVKTSKIGEEGERKTSKGISGDGCVPKRDQSQSNEEAKYVVTEVDDAVVIEDKGRSANDAKRTVRQDECDKDRSNNGGRRKSRNVAKNARISREREEGEIAGVEDLPLKTPIVSSTVEKEARKILPKENSPAAAAATIPNAGDYDIQLLLPPPSSPLLLVDPLSVEDFNCDYHIVEKICGFPGKENAPSNHSDEDMEHICGSEVSQTRRVNDARTKGGRGSSGRIDVTPTFDRKTSRSTISDDDMEHIHSCDLTDESSAVAFNTCDPKREGELVRRKNIKSLGNIASSDDDMEHVLQSEVTCDSESAIVPEATVKQCGEISTRGEAKPVKSSGARNVENIVVVESKMCDAEVTIVTPLERQDRWRKSKTPEKDLAEEIDLCVEPGVAEREARLAKKPKEKGRTTSSALATHSSTIRKTSTASEIIEIIDIDALQKAEMETARRVPSTPECRILESRREPSAAATTKPKRNRRGRKAKSENETSAEIAVPLSVAKQKLLETEVCLAPESDDVEKTTDPVPAPRAALSSWSSIVKGNAPGKVQVRPPILDDVPAELRGVDNPRDDADENDGGVEPERHSPGEDYSNEELERSDSRTSNVSGCLCRDSDDCVTNDVDSRGEFEEYTAISSWIKDTCKSDSTEYTFATLAKDEKRTVRLDVESEDTPDENRWTKRCLSTFGGNGNVLGTTSVVYLPTVETGLEGDEEEEEEEVVVVEVEEEEEEEEDDNGSLVKTNLTNLSGEPPLLPLSTELESTTSASSEEPSPEPTLRLCQGEINVPPQQSSSSDDLNANALPADAEEEENSPRNVVETLGGNGASIGKKSKSKKKKRR